MTLRPTLCILRVLTEFEMMFDKLFGPKPPPAVAPEGQRLFAVGDIHGRVDLLDQLLVRLDTAEGAGAPEARLIFLGDYIDRGPAIRDVVDRLAALKAERPGTIFLMGNHEEALGAFLNTPEERSDWLDWGGEETLASYGVKGALSRSARDLSQDLRSRLPQSHMDFLNGLTLYSEQGDYFFAHAGVKPGVALQAQKAEDLLWIRAEFHDMPVDRRPQKVIVHGHQPVRRPLDLGWRIAIDTGAVYGGKLTAVALEGAQRRFVSV